MKTTPVDSEVRTLGSRGLTPAHADWLRTSVGTPIIVIVPQLAPTIENTGTPDPREAIPARAQQLYHLLTQRYSGSASTRELSRNYRFNAEEVATLAHDFPQLFRIESTPTTAHGSARRTVSAVTS